MTRILAIDPGTTESAYVLLEAETLRVLDKAKVDNWTLLRNLRSNPDFKVPLAMEMVASYGMPVGAEVFETFTWIGRFEEAHNGQRLRMPRLDVKLELCHNAAARDSNIRQATQDVKPDVEFRSELREIQKEAKQMAAFIEAIHAQMAMGPVHRSIIVDSGWDGLCCLEHRWI